MNKFFDLLEYEGIETDWTWISEGPKAYKEKEPYISLLEPTFKEQIGSIKPGKYMGRFNIYLLSGKCEFFYENEEGEVIEHTPFEKNIVVIWKDNNE